MIYFVQGGNDGPIKIGYTHNDIDARLSNFQVGSPEPLTLVASAPGGRHTERAIHIRFDHLRLHGEWFEPETELLDYIASIANTESPNADSDHDSTAFIDWYFIALKKAVGELEGEIDDALGGELGKLMGGNDEQRKIAEIVQLARGMIFHYQKIEASTN